ncbi:MAG: CidA/LrgA family protein [Lachnospiraceae bacterium]|nr:CidA/LrgA family protein [Lachnospiraceae bacterium]
MNYIFQLAIIFGVSFAGELLNAILPLPVPASVYGLVIMFLLLCTKIVKLEQVENVAEFLMSIMPLFFIEPTVGIMNSYGLVKGKILPLFIACFLSFVVVMVVTGLISQAIIRFQQKTEKSGIEQSETNR